MQTEEYAQQITAAANFLRENLGVAEVVITLGSGLLSFADRLVDAKAVAFRDVPFMPFPSVSGHGDRIMIGKMGSRTVMVFTGRIHGYEGIHPLTLAFAARVIAELGCRLYVCTNSSGGAVPGMQPGCLTFLTDLVNLARKSYLIEASGDGRLGERHPDLSQVFANQHLDKLRELAAKHNIPLFDGKYGGSSGPSYETPAEVMAGVSAGAAVFGMSTVPEVSTLAALHVPVVGIAMVTNVAAGFVIGKTLTHAEVKEAAAFAMPAFASLLVEFVSTVELPPAAEFQRGSAPSAKLYYPMPTIRRPTLANAVAVLKATQNISFKLLPSVIFAPKVIAESIPKDHAWPLSDILGQGAASEDAQCGEFRLVKSGTGYQVVISTGSLVGLAADEAALLVWALRLNGCSTVVVVTRALSTSGSTEHKSVSLNGAVAANSHVPHSAPAPLWSADSGSLLGSADIALQADGAGAYFASPGAEPPTPAELAWASKCGCSVAGVTSLAPLLAANDMGLKTAAVAQIVPQLSSTETQQSDQAFLKSVVDALRDVAVQAALDVALPEPVPAETFVPESPQQTSYAAVTQTVQAIRKRVPDFSPTIGIVIDAKFESVLAKDLKVRTTVTLGDDGLYPQPRKGRQLKAGRLFDVDVWILNDASNSRDDWDLAEATYGTRLLRTLGTTTLINLSVVVSCSDRTAQSQVAVLSDHINLIGRTPLTGHNEDPWGERFPDMSHVYDVALRQAAVRAGAVEVIAGYVQTAASKAERVAAAAMTAHAAMSTTVAEAIVASQMRQRVCTLAAIVPELTGATAAELRVLVQPLAAVLEIAQAPSPAQ
eukprot:TRINITY_DN4884_c0_g1_i3.p1 TRINITY_DN4884_c0_g1~~TRINITY_DN4884_c0_g1_i3.p1  ORF type:complete len:826 (-),score=195.64 TRINITY_DN4884_c0_g1_i3:101-2578(-)